MLLDIDDILCRIAPHLLAFDLVTDDELTQADKLATYAKNYRALNHNADSIIANRVAEIADKLADDAKRSPDKVLTSASAIPDVGTVQTIAEKIERNLNRQAREIVLARASELPGMLNAELQNIADETATVAAELGNVNNAAEAINRDLVDQWRRAQQLIDAYKGIAALAIPLRQLSIVPSPTGWESGPHWMFLRDEDRTTWLPADATPWQQHVRDMARGPWIPATKAEAQAVADSWTNVEGEA